MLIVLLLLPFVGVGRADSNVVSSSLTIQVYADGSAYMTQNISVRSSAPSISVRLLSSVLSSVVVTDENGTPLEYQLSGTNITIYTLGARDLQLRYDSLDLTNKTVTVWTVAFDTDYNTTLILPHLSTLSYISGTPTTFAINGGYPTVTLAPGRWDVSYGVSIGSIAQTTTNTGATQTVTGTSSTQSGSALTDVETLAAVALIIAAAVVLAVFWRRRLGTPAVEAGLRPDDVQVLNFVAEKGGKVLEPEIRTRFALPKTSAWRQIKRLERLGYVKVTKIGSQNQIELMKKRERGP